MELFPQGLVKETLINSKGEIIPITPEWDHRYGITLMNPSIYNDNGIIKACVRCVNYTMHHSEKGRFPFWAGPLQYIHPENDVKLKTENFLAVFDDELNIKSFKHIKMQQLHEPMWEFHGLEDGRLFRWNDKLYICGVRRDTTENGMGRMEASELSVEDDPEFPIEIKRTRIPAIDEQNSYCEKNWMPIIDKPNNFITWANPTVILTWDPEQNSITSRESGFVIPNRREIRGSSQVIPYKNFYIALGHDTVVWKPYTGEKDGNYNNYVMLWDDELNLLKISKPFKFMNSSVEFCCGICRKNDDFLISFSDMDNSAFILKVNSEWFLNKLFKDE